MRNALFEVKTNFIIFATITQFYLNMQYKYINYVLKLLTLSVY